VPLENPNALPGIAAVPQSNSDDELSVLRVWVANTQLGMLVDGSKEKMGVEERDVVMPMKSAEFDASSARQIGLVAMGELRS
jgi:hypothetical protein